MCNHPIIVILEKFSEPAKVLILCSPAGFNNLVYTIRHCCIGILLVSLLKHRLYQINGKKIIASCASFAVTVKSVLDTPLLTDEGLLTEESFLFFISVSGDRITR